MRHLLLLFMISAAQAAEIVPNSVSPDRKLQIAVEVTDAQARYHVATRKKHFLPGSFPSDYWRVDQCLNSRVIWRRDGAYFVIEEGSSGIHQEFVVAHKTVDGYSALPFDRGVIMDSSKLSWHHGAVRFDRWLPKNHLAVTIYGDLDGFKGDFECKFVLDLKHDLRVLLYHVVMPK